MKYGLEQLVFAQRERGQSAAQIAAMCNDELVHQGVADTLTSKAIERYFASLDKASVPVAHSPQVAEDNAVLAVNVAARLGLLDGKLTKWIEEADLAVTPMKGVVYDVHTQTVISEQYARSDGFEGEVVDVLVPDWQARGIASRELREALKVVADVLQRVHDAEEVRAFQMAVSQAIAEASPEVAQAVLLKMRENRSIRRSILLGASP